MNIKEEEAWAAGYISAAGSFLAAKTFRKAKFTSKLFTRLVVKSKTKPEAIVRLGRVLDCTVRFHNDECSIVLSGDQLHETMKKLWPYLTRERKLEYQAIRIMVREAGSR